MHRGQYLPVKKSVNTFWQLPAVVVAWWQHRYMAPDVDWNAVTPFWGRGRTHARTHVRTHIHMRGLPSQTRSSWWQVDKEAIGLSIVQQLYNLCEALPDQISVNSIVKHIHTTSIKTTIWQFVPFIYHPL